jgi:hypothetical protein
MAKKRNPQGAAVIFLETDLEKAQPFDESNLTSTQRQYFYWLSSNNQEKVRAGYGVIVVDLESKDPICTFNMENYHPPEGALDSFARALLPTIRRFYSVEENRRAYEEYLKNKGRI